MHVFRRFRIVLAALAASVALGAQSATLPTPSATRIDEIVAAEQARQKIPGVSIAVAFRNQLIYSQAYGSADLEHGVTTKPTTAFRTASVAKPLTATGVMMLVAAGKMTLDGPIRSYCAGWPEKHPPITVRQVMAHLSGIRHYTKQGEGAGKTHFFELQDSLSLFKNDPLLHEPGSKYFYSTYGYSLLGCAMEGASGATYERFMTDNVFARAAMTRTRLDRIYEIVPSSASSRFVMIA